MSKNKELMRRGQELHYELTKARENFGSEGALGRFGAFLSVFENVYEYLSVFENVYEAQISTKSNFNPAIIARSIE